MKLGVRADRYKDKGKFKFSLLCAHLFFFTPCFCWLLSAEPPLLAARTSSCRQLDVKALTEQLLKDLPSYANRVSQRSRRLNRSVDFYTYVLAAGRPEFAPLTLGPGENVPASPTSVAQDIEQVFITTLERQYSDGKTSDLQGYHWLFLTKTSSGWRLATMFSRFGDYPSKRPPTPPEESSQGVIGQAVSIWLRDCQAPEHDK